MPSKYETGTVQSNRHDLHTDDRDTCLHSIRAASSAGRHVAIPRSRTDRRAKVELQWVRSGGKRIKHIADFIIQHPASQCIGLSKHDRKVFLTISVRLPKQCFPPSWLETYSQFTIRSRK